MCDQSGSNGVMADENVFIFSQEDLLTSSFSVFHDMQKKGEFSDVTIMVDNHVFSAHRIVLVAAIPYFRAMFTSNLSESKEKVITMKELDPTALESLINFAYTGKLKITTENVQSLLIASEFLELTQVRDICCDFLKKRLDCSNVMHIRALADSLNCLSLVENSDVYIRKNFDDFCKTKEFLSLSFNFLNELIRRDDLCIKSEENVFHAVMTWVKSDTRRHNLLPDLLSGVRMMLLTPEFLIKKASREELISQSLLCKNLLDEAKHYHMLPEELPSGCSFTLSERCCEERGTMYLFCSNKSTGLTVMKYISSTRKWITVLNDETRNDVLHVIALNDQIYIFRNTNVFEMFNPRTLECTSRMNYPVENRPFRYAVPFGNKIYWLSDNSCTERNKTLVFDAVQNKWLEQHQTALFISHGELLSCGKVIYALSCRDDQYDSSGNANKIYFPQTGTVSKVNVMREKRIGFGTAVLDGKLYVCGGTKNETGPSSIHVGRTLTSVEVLDSRNWNFLPVSSMHTARQNLSLVAYNKKLYAIGGNTAEGITNNIIECYDPATKKWTVDGILSGKYDFLKPVVISEAPKA